MGTAESGRLELGGLKPPNFKQKIHKMIILCKSPPIQNTLHHLCTLTNSRRLRIKAFL